MSRNAVEAAMGDIDALLAQLRDSQDLAQSFGDPDRFPIRDEDSASAAGALDFAEVDSSPGLDQDVDIQGWLKVPLFFLFALVCRVVQRPRDCALQQRVERNLSTHERLHEDSGPDTVAALRRLFGASVSDSLSSSLAADSRTVPMPSKTFVPPPLSPTSLSRLATEAARRQPQDGDLRRGERHIVQCRIICCAMSGSQSFPQGLARRRAGGRTTQAPPRTPQVFSSVPATAERHNIRVLDDVQLIPR
jgi:hypothetical protein